MTIDWKILECKRIPGNGLIVEVVWAVYVTKSGETRRHVGISELDGDVDDPDFIPFTELTEQTIIQWVQVDVGTDNIESITTTLEYQIDDHITNQSTIVEGLPWEVTDLLPVEPED